MKRSPLVRRTPLKSKSELKRTAIKRTTPKRDPLDPDLRERVLRRDAYTCQASVRGFPHLCAGRLHAHHVRLRSQGGPDTMDNLVAVCAVAHHDIHFVDRALAEHLGLIRRARA